MCDLDLLNLGEPDVLEVGDCEVADLRELPHVREAKDGEPLVGSPCVDMFALRGPS